MKTNKQITENALNSSYLNGRSGRINEDYLNEALILRGMNVQSLWNDIANSKRSVRALVWQTLTEEANDLIKFNENANYYASSDQLKNWLNEYGRGYETLKATADYFTAERNV